jgi:putative pyruvate formate lyase activating enzyme
VIEIFRQVGDLPIDEEGLGRRGLLVRPLVMPHGQAGTRNVMEFLAYEVSPGTFIHLMDQYRPACMASSYPALNRELSGAAYEAAVRLAHKAGLHRFDQS